MAQTLANTQLEDGPATTCSATGWSNARLNREWNTVEVMIRCYCRHRHRSGDRLCPECQSLHDYARLRLESCRFGEEKPTCAKCPVHCYQRERREQIREVMRFAGPRMLFEHPLLSLRHWIDSFRRPASA